MTLSRSGQLYTLESARREVSRRYRGVLKKRVVRRTEM
jgi:hypothetical protein